MISCTNSLLRELQDPGVTRLRSNQIASHSCSFYFLVVVVRAEAPAQEPFIPSRRFAFDPAESIIRGHFRFSPCLNSLGVLVIRIDLTPQHNLF